MQPEERQMKTESRNPTGLSFPGDQQKFHRTEKDIYSPQDSTKTTKIVVGNHNMCVTPFREQKYSPRLILNQFQFRNKATI